MRQFRWLHPGLIPAGLDLRRCGWALADATGMPDSDDVPECPLLGDARLIDIPCWLRLIDPARTARRRWIMLVGLRHPRERADLLRMGFGEALGTAPMLEGVAARAWRIAVAAEVMPRRRRHGPLVLDLLRRDGLVDARALGLHPREFALLWRLMDPPGVAVGRTTLLREVWQIQFRPETNSLAVHVSRLRAKLALAGLGGMVQTTATGGYVLAPATQTAEAVPDPTACVTERAAWKTILPWELSR